ncbi:glutaredoxin family protein [Natronobacterium gregoryi]|uniref:Redoxin n=2 Tax=Natronobacterium gregoryi TaxID=44930 RepID=L0AM80_NATGS|nr:thioredoxin family protein [Natronobacterium gregoryi]AFZ74135.1 Redoxin [Natronobacterium gregoryi SP2]ELY63872.1 hypothetical protein C490_15102 [Natronobacterium gregoryi SP2]PLK22070.1 thioredoxin family protein [Natronobacterium gregoryi SP2]SFI50106.1 Glutaredoxin [Natronobacterium gregoryi]
MKKQTRTDSNGRSRITRRTYLTASGLGLGGGLAGCLESTDAKDSTFATAPEDVDSAVVVIWFWGDGCPVCEEQRSFFETLHERDDVAVLAYEVYNDQENQDKFRDVVETYQLPNEAVPVVFVGDRYWIGDSEQIRSGIESAIDQCDENQCSTPRLLE